MDKILFFGKPGAGKGTIINKVMEKRRKCLAKWTVLSTGNALREAVNEKTELGQQAKEYMDRGDLVPDEIIVGIVKDALQQLQEGNVDVVILDGFPRTLSQAESMVEMGIVPYMVFNLDVSDEEVINRLANRVECEKCRAPYSLINDEFKPKLPGVCDKCGANLIHRADDNREVVSNRLKTYAEQTAPVLDFLKNMNLTIHEISSDISVEDIEFLIL